MVLRDDESPEAGANRFNNLSPISYALAKADDENLPWVVVTQGNRLRLYSTALDAGVGRRSRTETYVECQPSLLADDDLAYLGLYTPRRRSLPTGVLRRSSRTPAGLRGIWRSGCATASTRRSFRRLPRGSADARDIDRRASKLVLDTTYEMALTVLFRLLFIAYAEDRDLLPFRFNDADRNRSLKRKAQELAKRVHEDAEVADGDGDGPDGESFPDDATAHPSGRRDGTRPCEDVSRKRAAMGRER